MISHLGGGGYFIERGGLLQIELPDGLLGKGGGGGGGMLIGDN